MDDNQKTLATYSNHVDQYIAKTPKAPSRYLTKWIDRALSLIRPTADILEIGSAFGRDADYIESKGYKVQRSDAAQGFTDLLRSQGHEVKQLNVLTDKLDGPFNMIIANAVLLHFKPGETEQVLNKFYASLKPGGIIAFTVKEGNGSGWSEERMDGPRFFCYWQSQPLTKLVAKAGFKDIQLTRAISRHANWLQVIATRP